MTKAGETSTHKFKIYGKTEQDVESQFSGWQQKNPGLAFKRHTIEPLPVKRHVAFSMLIEYEIDFGGRPRTIRY
jgi:hypothetical protein